MACFVYLICLVIRVVLSFGTPPLNALSLSQNLRYLCTHVVEFVYLTSDNYKVVRLAYVGFTPKVEVFSLSSGTWRLVNNNVESCINNNYWSQAFIHSNLHWVAYKMIKNDPGDRTHRISILKFDLRSEKFSELGFPEDLAGTQLFNFLATVVNGQLSIFYNNKFEESVAWDLTNSCAVWVMKEYNNVESWTQLFKVRLEMLSDGVSYVKKDGKIVFFEKSGELSIYDFENGAVTKTGIYPTRTTCSFFVDRFVESLVLLGYGKEVQGTQPN